MSLSVQILTPLEQVVAGPFEEVVAPLADGWIGVRPGHRPFLARLMRGQVVLRAAGAQTTVATSGGTISVTPRTVVILTGAAAVDADFATLERARGRQGEQIRGVEQEAEKHFDRVYRSLARTLNQQRRGAG